MLVRVYILGMLSKTKNDLSLDIREKLTAILQQRLVESIDFQLQSKQSHWNVKGPQFISLHKLFDEVTEQAGEYTDELAERLVQLGGTAEGGAALVASKSGLPVISLTVRDGMAHAEALATVSAEFGKRIRKSIDEAAALGDAGTADLFTEISRGLDKSLWMLEAHLG